MRCPSNFVSDRKEVAKHLHKNEAINAYMEEAMETDDPAFIAQAMGTIARARGMFRDGCDPVCRA